MKTIGKESNAIIEVKELAAYVAGFSSASGDENLESAAKWLYQLSENICSQGFVGCEGGMNCGSDHK